MLPAMRSVRLLLVLGMKEIQCFLPCAVSAMRSVRLLLVLGMKEIQCFLQCAVSACSLPLMNASAEYDAPFGTRSLTLPNITGTDKTNCMAFD
jgi:hypothetical protein